MTETYILQTCATYQLWQPNGDKARDIIENNGDMVCNCSRSLAIAGLIQAKQLHRAFMLLCVDVCLPICSLPYHPKDPPAAC